MSRSIAIVAHYDPDDVVSESFARLVGCLSGEVDHVYIVSTCNLDESVFQAFVNTTLTTRPNIGYDFYSWRVGLSRAASEGDFDRCILTNSSITIVNEEKFSHLLRKMTGPATAKTLVGVTESNQIDHHLQSYLMAFGQTALATEWFWRFFLGVEPKRTKIETILNYEIELTKIAEKNGLTPEAVFQPTARQISVAKKQWLQWLRDDGQSTRKIALRRSRAGMQFNPAHFMAGDLARDFGFIKTEVLRDNPHGVDLSGIYDCLTDDQRATLERETERLRRRYQRTAAGLSTLADSQSPLPKLVVASVAPADRLHARVAVVVHLYHLEAMDDIAQVLDNILLPFDLIVTTPFEDAVKLVFERLAPIAKATTVALSENRGRDIGPFVSAYRAGLMDKYDAVLKLHSKKSPYSDKGEFWRKKIFSDLAGNSLTVLKSVDLVCREGVGIVGPDRYYLTHDRFWGSNRETMARLLDAMSILDTASRFELGFFAGSMFWFSPPALQPLKTAPESALWFEAEAGQQDGTAAHAIERLFCALARNKGSVATSLKMRGVDMKNGSSINNDVPVL